MGSPLGPALANIFVGYQEAKLFNIAKRPLVYFVDDTFDSTMKCNNFFIQLLPSLRVTYEKESNHSLPFLDVLVERHDSNFSLQYTGNLANIYVGTVHRNGKSI